MAKTTALSPKIIMNTMPLKILVALLVLGGCFGTPLKDYTPTSAKEAEIKKVLIKYEDCWNRKDTACIKTLFTKDAQIMVGGRQKRVISVNNVGAADKAAIQLVKVQPYQLLVSDT